MSKKKIKGYEAQIEKLPDKKIFLNINAMEKGDYELNIIHQNKLIKKTTFKKS
jgi:hypothetical protein